jgi:hypothetical protein
VPWQQHDVQARQHGRVRDKVDGRDAPRPRDGEAERHADGALHRPGSPWLVADHGGHRAPGPSGYPLGHQVGAGQGVVRAHPRRDGVRAHHHVRVEYLEQRQELSLARRREERVHDRTLLVRAGRDRRGHRLGRRRAQPPPRPARQLPGRCA